MVIVDTRNQEHICFIYELNYYDIDIFPDYQTQSLIYYSMVNVDISFDD